MRPILFFFNLGLRFFCEIWGFVLMIDSLTCVDLSHARSLMIWCLLLARSLIIEFTVAVCNLFACLWFCDFRTRLFCVYDDFLGCIYRVETLINTVRFDFFMSLIIFLNLFWIWSIPFLIQFRIIADHICIRVNSFENFLLYLLSRSSFELILTIYEFEKFAAEISFQIRNLWLNQRLNQKIRICSLTSAWFLHCLVLATVLCSLLHIHQFTIYVHIYICMCVCIYFWVCTFIVTWFCYGIESELHLICM